MSNITDHGKVLIRIHDLDQLVDPLFSPTLPLNTAWPN